MKKTICSGLAMVGMVLLMVSCTHDDVLEESVQVTFTATLPESTHSRAGESFGTGEYVDRLYCAIYEKTGETYTFLKQEVVGRTGNGFSYSPYLTREKTYKIAFWAMTEGAYYIDSDLTYVWIPSTMTCNDYTRDAFAGVSGDVAVGMSSGASIHVELKRPFAMLNLATTMTQEQENAIVDMTAEVTVTCTSGFARGYNVFEDKVIYDPNQKEVTFTRAKILGTKCVRNNVEYIRLASNYIIPPAVPNEEVTVKISVKKGDDIIGVQKETDIPLTVNYSTNLYGKILTGSAGTTDGTN